MPDQGTLTEDLVPHAAPTLSPLYVAPPWHLPGGQMLRVIYETDKQPLLANLPPKLTRSSPPYAVLSIESYPESPVGAFAMATQYIGCRAGFFIRAFALQAVVNTAPALAALRETWGMPAKPGKVELSLGEGGVQGTVQGTVARSGTGRARTVARVSLDSVEEIDPSLCRIDPVLCLRLAPSLQENVRHDLIQLVQLDPEYEITRAGRGKGEIVYPASAQEDAWGILPCRNVISAVYCELNTELPLARFVMPY